MADSIRVNGVEYDYGSIILKIDGEVFHGFTELNYSHKRTHSKTYGMGRHRSPRGRTSGRYEADNTKLKGPLESWDAVRKYLASKSESGKSYGNIPFQIVAQYLEGDREITDELEDNVITSEASSHSEGPDGLQEEVELDTFRIWKNGMCLWEQ